MALPGVMSPKTAKMCALKAQQMHPQEGNRPVEELLGETQVAVNYIREYL
jgi:hypothetical protein